MKEYQNFYIDANGTDIEKLNVMTDLYFVTLQNMIF